MWVLLLVAVSCQTASKGGGVNISPRLPEAEIRLEILQYTPAGSTAEHVLEFIRTRLRHLGPEPEGGQRPEYQGLPRRVRVSGPSCHIYQVEFR